MATAVLTGCAGGASGPAGPVVSPTGIVYEPGTPPSETQYSQTAALYLRSDEPERALRRALEGVEADPGNPIHHFLAGVAHARLGAYEAADSLWKTAQRIYPAYELDIEPERLAAWADAFNEGSDAYAERRDSAAIRAWRDATLMYNLRPEAHRNLGMLLTQQGRLNEAAEVYRDLLEGLQRVPATRHLSDEARSRRAATRIETEERLSEALLLSDRYAEAEPLLRQKVARNPEDPRARQALADALVGQELREEARAIYDELLADDRLDGTDLHNLGVTLFRAGFPKRAAEAFRLLTEARPDARDAWFNYANALLASERWETLVAVTDQLVQLDPLGEGAGMIAARARLESGDEQGALQRLEEVDTAPVHLEGLVLQPASSATRLEGRVVGNAGEPGSALRLRFTFFGEGSGDAGRAYAETSVQVPPADESHPLELTVGIRATGYRYEVVETAESGG
ncbi:MAG: tetratricopeptide repeat protein [Gemmatimonadota bacterium]|nr:tetratricopeptide repeat protein [Gemmatimonadota bacterium]